MNTPELTFLGWNAPAIELVAQKLFDNLSDKDMAPLYRRATIVVPTKESGRRLRERLAELAERPILIPRIILAEKLIPTEAADVATEAETMAAWLMVLADESSDPVTRYAPLIPGRPDAHRERWAVGVAHKLMNLRARLEQEEVSIDQITGLLCKREETAQSHLSALKGSDLEKSNALQARKAVFVKEQARWRKLGELFHQVDALISKKTISRWMEEWVKNPSWKGQSRLLILACVPELSPQLQTALLNLHGKNGGKVQIWVHADEKEAAHFDAFGLPLEASWLSRDMDIPDARIHLANDAAEVAEKAVELAGGYNSHEVALAVGDTDFSPAIVNAFGAKAWNLNLPEGRHLRSSDLGMLVAQLADACAERAHAPMWNDTTGSIQNNTASGLDAFVALLYNTTLQQALCGSAAQLSALQEHVERIRMLLLPGSESMLLQHLKQIPQVNEGYKSIVRLEASHDHAFFDYAERVSHLLNELCGSNQAKRLNKLAGQLESAIKDSTLSPIARKIAREIKRCAEIAPSLPGPAYTMELLNLRVQNKISGPAFTTQAQSAADVLGWRELAYTSGKQVIIAAMHDGCIPEPVPEDDFLPESLCNELGIRHEKFRIARDSYLLTALLESRQDTGGNVDFIVARQKADGSQLAPSSLLLRCGDKLPERARMLFAESRSAKPLPAAAACPLLRAEKSEASIQPGMLESISQIYGSKPNPFTIWHTSEDGNKYQRSYSPSSLSLFLQCPLSFWIKNLFHIDLGETYKEGKGELESNEYGTILHAVLDKLVEKYPSQAKLLAQCPEAKEDTNAAKKHLLHAARQLASQEWQQVYHSSVSRDTQALSMEVQLQAIERTLAAFVQQHVQDLHDGWLNVAREHTFESSMNLDAQTTVSFSMNADRIDYNPTTNRWRIIDYKTSANEKRPHKIHFDELIGGEDSTYCRFMNVQGYKFGTVELGKKIYRWNDVQLPLYTYGLRNPSARDRDELGLGNTDMSAVMPDLVYYNLQSKTEELQCHFLVKDGEVQPISTRAKEVPTAEQMYESAMETVTSAIRMIRAGKCLFSAESLELKHRPFSPLNADNHDSKAPRFGALSQQNDPRCMFMLPPLSR